MQSYYVGNDLKFKIEIECAGFSMQDDNFIINLVQNNKSVEVRKSQLIEDDNNYYLPVDTTQFKPGTVKMVVTAYVPDDDFPNGIRREVAVSDLFTVKKTT